MIGELSILALTFMKIGLGAFGGGLATIPFIHYELVVSRPWLTEKGFAEVVSLAQMTPGPIAVNAATFVGYRIAGFPGSAVATASVIGAPLAVIIAVTWLLSKTTGKWKEWTKKVQKALRPVVTGMLFTAFWMVLRPIIQDKRLWLLTGLLWAAAKIPLLKRFPQILLLGAGAAGYLLF